MLNWKKTAVYGVFGLNLVVILVGWVMGSGRYFVADPAKILLVGGRLLGLLAVYLVLAQLIFVGRQVWVEKVFGQDKLTLLHRWNGFVIIWLLMGHFIFLLWSYAWRAEVGWWEQLVNFFNNYTDVGEAILALLLFLVVAATSIAIVRKKFKYEAWYFVHLLTYLAIIFSFGHQLQVGGDFLLKNKWFGYYWYALYGMVFLSFAYFRVVKPVWNFWRFRFEIHQIIQETEDSYSIYLKPGRGSLKSWPIEAGQFMSVRFLAKGFWFQSHPFSLSWLPKNNCLRITIKKLGDFTAKVSQLKVGTKVMVEGPFGLFQALPGQGHKYLMVAGGVGITPIRALLEKTVGENDVILLYCNRKWKDIIFRQELADLQQRYLFKMVNILSDEPGYDGESGRLDLEKIQRLVPDITDREIYLCGPVPMMVGLKKTLKEDCGVSSKKIRQDVFAW